MTHTQQLSKVYSTCGHVQSNWHTDYLAQLHASSEAALTCPICRKKSAYVVPLSIGIEPAFHFGGPAVPLDHA